MRGRVALMLYKCNTALLSVSVVLLLSVAVAVVLLLSLLMRSALLLLHLKAY